MSDYYSVLGVSRDAEPEVIAAAYKALMRKYHPDTSLSEHTSQRAQAINEAYQTLRNAELRSHYDMSQQRSRASTPPPPPPRSPPPPPPPPPPKARAMPSGEGHSAPDRSGHSTSRNVGLVALALLGVVLLTWVKLSEADPKMLAEDANSSPPFVQESALPVAEEVIPTMGQFEKAVTTAAQDFLEVYDEGGLGAAQAKSKQCHAESLTSDDILKTDYCTSFDMAAVLVDLLVAKQRSMQQDAYFQKRSKELDSDYARFQQASSARTEIIWQQVKSVVFPQEGGESLTADKPKTLETGFDERGKKGQCRLQVRTVTYIDGECWIRLDSDGSFQILSLDEQYLAQLNRSGGEAIANWNEFPGDTHAQSGLGLMRRDDACWRNNEAEICAWAT